METALDVVGYVDNGGFSIAGKLVVIPELTGSADRLTSSQDCSATSSRLRLDPINCPHAPPLQMLLSRAVETDRAITRA